MWGEEEKTKNAEVGKSSPAKQRNKRQRETVEMITSQHLISWARVFIQAGKRKCAIIMRFYQASTEHPTTVTCFLVCNTVLRMEY